MENRFVLCQGVSADGTENLRSGCRITESGGDGLLSGDVIAKVATEFIRAVPEPIFFFLELPAEGEEYDVYYLDSCTKKVALAIMKRYGTLLVEDGCSRFGFGSHKTDEEIYFTDYQEFMIYSEDTSKVRRIMAECGVEETDKPMSVWDLLSEENQGCLSVVEYEGETVFDIPENLKEVGMYKSEN